MKSLLDPLSRETPYVITYVDKGVGASILKAGLRLWDGNVSSVAAIKVTQHNLYRPTAIIHETGHQVAHVLNWNNELAAVLKNELPDRPHSIGKSYSSWSSEIAADSFAFCHTGFAAVAALHDVVSGSPSSVFAYHRHDPHPISYIRVLMNIEMCRQFYGHGPWNALEDSFRFNYDINKSNQDEQPLIRACEDAIPKVVSLVLKRPYQSFGNYSLTDHVKPELVSPEQLSEIEKKAGEALFNSHAWVSNECLRILALIGYKMGTGRGNIPGYYQIQERWMMKLGFTAELN
jgi:hypothetical protein